MDPSDLDPEMAAFMGFSSFGTQPAAKKRKYNPRADASSADATAATGANQTVLAARVPSSTNADEIDLEDDAPAPEDADNEEGGASLYSDPSLAPALAHAQGLVDEMTARQGDSGAVPAAGTATSLPPSLPVRPDASWGGKMGVPPTTMPDRGVQDRGRGGRDQQQRGGDGKPWYEGYYDRRSNENPWARLEAAAGVAPRGSWAQTA